MLKPVRAVCVYLMRKSWLVYPLPPAPAEKNTAFSIGIVTYIRRYEEFFRPLITYFCRLFPDTEIVVAVNGYYDQAAQEKYLVEITAFLGQFPNVKVLAHTTPESLSKLWNKLIINSTAEKTLICNDDLLLLPTFRRHLEASGLLAEDVGLIKWSWSHFIISKRIVSQVGWFDERFPGVGNEDEDYEARLAHLNIPVPTFMMGGLRNITVKTEDFSYGKNMAVVNRKYTGANKEFFDSKWELSETAQPGFAYVRLLRKYARIKPGMETPDFHPDIHYHTAST